jgi:myo-inositol-1(or 4)-monophosphatase
MSELDAWRVRPGSGLLELALNIALEAGALQRDQFREPRTIRTKSSAIDLVTDVDHASERLILERIAAARSDDAILSEEDGETSGSSGRVWIIDPLDGTTNYAHGIPHFAVSIGIERDGERELGVVYDPMKEELFWAVRGEGAFMNGERIGTSGADDLRGALLATGFAYDVHSASVDNVDFFSAFIKRAQAVRRIGSAALDLAYLACGRFDGFWELNLHPWDVAAGYLLVEEAGGTVSNLEGGPAPRSGSDVVGSNGALHPQLLEVVAEVVRAR